MTPPGTLITITATVTADNCDPVTASRTIVVLRDAPWGVVFAPRFDPMLNGCRVRRIVGGVVEVGIQTVEGGLFRPEE